MWLIKLGIVPLTALMLMSGCSLHENLPTASSDPTLGPIAVQEASTRSRCIPVVIEPCGEILTSRLMAGQNYEAGTVTISNNADTLQIVVSTIGGWLIGTSHLHLALTPDDFPVTKKGAPKIGLFDYAATYDPYTSMITYTFMMSDIPLSAGDKLYVAFHAEVFNSTLGTGVQAETAWGEGPEFPGRSWAMYMSYTIQECDPDDPNNEPGPTGFRTQTQGGWGTVANGNNPGAYRDANFDAAFPAGATIGRSPQYHATFQSSGSIASFLPASSTAGSFTMNYINPLTTEAGVFAGQVLALTLSVGFDLYDPSFGASTTHLEDLVIADGDLIGESVGDVLYYANEALGGGLAPYTIPQLNSAVSSINECYVDGTVNKGYLKLP